MIREPELQKVIYGGSKSPAPKRRPEKTDAAQKPESVKRCI
jgi:hypothetical protein